MAVDDSEHIFTGAENQSPADMGTSRPPVRDRIVELRRVRAGDLVPIQTITEFIVGHSAPPYARRWRKSGMPTR